MKKIIIFSVLLSLALSACSNKTAMKTISIEEAKAQVVDFVNNNLMPEGQTVSVKEITEDRDLYKLVINMSSGQEITSYITKDGAKFFPQVMDVEEVKMENQEKKDAPEASKPVAQAPKADEVSVELFVMSHCPYGTQVEKGILPVLETLGDKIDFVVKFNDYAMHGKKELDEQLNQVCIQENEPEKYAEYLTCFLEADDGEGCLKGAKINQSKLSTCVAATDKEYKVTELYNDKSTWKSGRFPQFNVSQTDNQKYGVTGSPSLVVNGAKISSARDAASLLATICSGFNNPPEECSTELSSTPPSPGFGFEGSGSNTAAGCGS